MIVSKTEAPGESVTSPEFASEKSKGVSIWDVDPKTLISAKPMLRVVLLTESTLNLTQVMLLFSGKATSKVAALLGKGPTLMPVPSLKKRVPDRT